jgi:hypothetical protein
MLLAVVGHLQMDLQHTAQAQKRRERLFSQFEMAVQQTCHILRVLLMSGWWPSPQQAPWVTRAVCLF